jgi:predicted ATP-grasp superfamily ATP-dependent carboligase
MSVFVCEYVTGGGCAGASLPGGLLHEAELMVRALAGDLARIGGVELLVARDARLLPCDLPGRLVPVGPDDDCWAVWADAAREADAIWPVAPETDGLLLRLSEMAAACGAALLGSRPEAVRLCGSKLATAQHLASHGIAVVPTALLGGTLPAAEAGWVVKPDDGAGAGETFAVPDAAALAALEPTLSPGWSWVVQPFVRGDGVSLSLLCRDGEVALMSCNAQHIGAEAGGFRYRGWTVGGREDLRARCAPIARAAAGAVPGLWGYAGVDLIDTESGPVFLEINPRLTTPYAALREAIGLNPAELVLRLGLSGPMPEIGVVSPTDLRL